MISTHNVFFSQQKDTQNNYESCPWNRPNNSSSKSTLYCKKAVLAIYIHYGRFSFNTFSYAIIER